MAQPRDRIIQRARKRLCACRVLLHQMKGHPRSRLHAHPWQALQGLREVFEGGGLGHS